LRPICCVVIVWDVYERTRAHETATPGIPPMTASIAAVTVPE